MTRPNFVHGPTIGLRWGRKFCSHFSAVLSLTLVLQSVPANGTVFELPADGSAVVGADITITSHYKDTLLGFARQYSLGYDEIIRANPGVDMWLPGEGTQIFLPGRRILPPGPHEGVVVSLPEHRLYYFPKETQNGKRVVITYPVSIGKLGRNTPLGNPASLPKSNTPRGIRRRQSAKSTPRQVIHCQRSWVPDRTIR